MAVAVKDEAAKFKADWLEAKKRASDLQGEVDAFSKERKAFQELEEANAELKAELADEKANSKELAAQLKSAEADLASAIKALDKAEAQNAAAQKIKEGLAALS